MVRAQSLILKKVLEKIVPNSDEEKKLREFIRNLVTVARLKSGLDAIVVGSIGKGTWLSGDHDIDLFLIFPKSTSREELEEKGLDYGKKIVKELGGDLWIKYAEHPYTHAIINNYDVDIVPCYKTISGEKIISAVDRSPHHLEFVISNLKADMVNEVRLLKQFMKGIGVYSSDAKNLGFSGYVCEILIIKYGSFKSVLKTASKWSVPQIITDSKKQAKKFREPLVIIDPVDKERNAAAVVSSENLIKFINASKNFLKEPDIEYFFPQKKELNEKEIEKLKDRGTNFVAITFAKPDVIDDILYPQLRKLTNRLENLLKENEFIPIKSSFVVCEKKIILVLEMEVWSLPNIKKMVGPPVFSARHSREFLTKYKNAEYGPMLEGDNWIIEKKREYKTATDLLEKFFCKEPDELMKLGVPSKLADVLFNSRVLEGDDFWKLLENKELSIFLKEKYFQRLV